jgi:large subunit ribosomal protein L29
MKYKDLKEKDASQLQHDLVEARKHLFTLRSQAVTEKLEDPSQLRRARKDIARLMTALHQRELDKKAASVKTAAPAPATAPAN